MTQAILAAALGAALSAGLTAGFIVYIGRAIRAESRAGDELVGAQATIELDQRFRVLELQREGIAELTTAVRADIAELAAAARGRYAGRYVIAHTPRPDDQSLRGWVRAEHRDDDGVLALELTDVDYLGDDGQVHASMPEAIVERVAWVQLLDPPAGG